MPGSATELNGQVSQTLLPQVSRLFGNRCPERKGKMPVQAINVRCLKCGYRLAWVLVEENGSGTKRRRFPFHATPMRFFSGWFSEYLSGSAGDSAQRGEGNCLLEAGCCRVWSRVLFITLRG